MLYQTKNPHGGGTECIRLDVSVNVNPFGTPKEVLDAVARTMTTLYQYPDPCCRKLICAISDFEQLPQEMFLCGNGAAELIYSFCAAERPASALEVAPTFSEYSAALRKTGCKIERYVLRQDNGFEIGYDFLEYLKKSKPNIVFLCNPNNPTGRVIDYPLLCEILTFCNAEKIRLFLDECFLDFTESGISMKQLVCQNPRLFILKAFTKNFGMAGLRLGYGICSDTVLLKKMSDTVQPWNVSSLAQSAGIAALQTDEFLARTRSLIRKERPWLKRELERCGFWVCPSDANYLLFHANTGLDDKLKQRGILIRNCNNFTGLSDGWYRVAIRLHSENKYFIEIIRDVL